MTAPSTPNNPPARPASAPPAGAAGLAGAQAPSLRLPFQFFAAALFFFLLLNLLLFTKAPALLRNSFAHPINLTATHLFTLGFASMVAMGALYQLIPVILQVRVYSERLGFIQFWLYLAGVSTMIASFWWFSPLAIATGGTLVTTAVGMFAYNLYRSMSGSTVRSLSARYIRAAVGYFSLTVTWGLLLALHLKYGFFGASTLRQLIFHFSIGLGGWLGLLVIGVGYQLIPMFGLVHNPPERAGRAIFAAFNAGVGLEALAMLLDLPVWVTTLGVTAAGAALLASVADGFRLLRRRKRQRLDASFRFVIASWSSLAAAALLLLAARWLDLPALHRTPGYLAIAYLGLMGWVSLMIQAQMYKILPFLVWQHRYSARVGREKVPLLRDMFSERLALWVLGFWLAAIPVTVIGLLLGTGTLLRLGLGLALAATLLFLGNVYQVATR